MGTTVDDLTRPEDFFSLGGFFNLSGLPPGYLSGPHYGIARLMYYRKIGRGGSGVLDLPAYVGLSLEAGNTWMRRDDISTGGLRKDGSLFFGVDTCGCCSRCCGSRMSSSSSTCTAASTSASRFCR